LKLNPHALHVVAFIAASNKKRGLISSSNVSELPQRGHGGVSVPKRGVGAPGTGDINSGGRTPAA
jgi:hypothetical protein